MIDIVIKEWIVRKPMSKGGAIRHAYLYRGYFLFGIIPLYIKKSKGC